MKTFQTKQTTKSTVAHKNPRLAERNEQRAARPTSKPLVAKKSTKPTASPASNEKKRRLLAKNYRKFWLVQGKVLAVN